tara:strand:- start:4 stop:480 length:477 start_codon:yes stop_codon:yes gene_type:complete
MSTRPMAAQSTMIYGVAPRIIEMNRALSKRRSECAAIELRNGKCRLIRVTWDETASVGMLDYFYAAFEVDGRWNAEFYDSEGRAVTAHGTEGSLEFEWEQFTVGIDNSETGRCTSSKEGIQVKVLDMELDDVPPGALCQTVEERDTGIPRHWKHWRII